MQRFCFASKNPKFRVFLKVVEAGGVWADFAPEGEYSTTDPEAAEKLRSMPNFGTDFWEPGGAKTKVGPASPAQAGVTYKCPDCEFYGDELRKVLLHANASGGSHKETYKKEDIVVIKEDLAKVA